MKDYSDVIFIVETTIIERIKFPTRYAGEEIFTI
jgi:hypothetical protein